MGSSVASLLGHSINTSSPGFLDKLYSSPSPPGIAAELVLATINNNAHVYNVSPALTLVEKHVGIELAKLFGLSSSLAGGVTVPGGAAANMIALLVARNARFPELKESGLASWQGRTPAIFMSEAAHYSALNAAQILGLGTSSVRKIATTQDGSMDASALKEEIQSAIQEGQVPFFVVATAGTTVRGAYDPLLAIGKLSHQYGAWFHVDACWGGAAAFSDKLRYKLLGSELADSVAFNPHKMLGVPLTCSFLLGRDLRTFWYANRLVAGYLFHNDVEDADTIALEEQFNHIHQNGHKELAPEQINCNDADWRTSPGLAAAPKPDSILDLASLTPQCGRRPDALKLYLHWRYYGKSGIARHVENTFEAAQYLAFLISKHTSLRLVGETDVPCAQVCFYHRGADAVLGRSAGKQEEAMANSYVTRKIIKKLHLRGWMVDYAPGTGREGEKGEFLRVACSRTTDKGVAEALVKVVAELGEEVVKEIGDSRIKAERR